MKRIQEYIKALLENPEFIMAATKQYGQVQSSGEGLVPSITMNQLAKAIADLEAALTATLPNNSSLN